MKRLALMLALSASLLTCVGCAGPYCRSRGGLWSSACGDSCGDSCGCGTRHVGRGIGDFRSSGCTTGACGGGCSDSQCGAGLAQGGVRPSCNMRGCATMGGGKYSYSNDCLGYPPAPSDAQWPTVGYPYYTLRGPRDFLVNNPPSIGR